MAPIPKNLLITIKNALGQKMSSASVVITLGEESLDGVTNSDGLYVFQLGNFSSWSSGDEITLTATKANQGTVTSTITLNASGTQSQTVNLVETKYTINDNTENRVSIHARVLTNFDGSFINRTNRLPVASDNQQFTKAFAHTTGNPSRILYEGEAMPGVGKNETGWRIKKFTHNSDGRATDEQWAGGTDAFDKIWNNRTDYNYS